MNRQLPRLLLMLLWFSLSACTQVAPYSIKDSGVPAVSFGGVTWLNNQRVLFSGLKESSKSGSPDEYDLFVWDTAKGKGNPYPALNGTGNVCVRGDLISYSRPPNPGAENERLLVYGKVRDGQIVEEQVTPLPKETRVNPFSCRVYAFPPPWTVKGRRTTPPLEAHGYLDWGPSDPFLGASVPLEERYVRLYRPGDAQGMQLSLARGGQKILQISYAALRNAYFIPSANYQDPVTGKVLNSTEWPKDKPMPVWWLTPEGKVTEEAMPYHPFMARAAGRGFLPVKGGVFAWSHAIGLGASLGEAGGCLARDGTTRKVIAGMLHNPVVSPDGCRVAFVHEPQFPTDEAHRSVVKVKVLALCDGDDH